MTRFLVVLISLAAFMLSGCPDYKVLSEAHLTEEGYQKVELTPSETADNSFNVIATKEGIDCKGTITAIAMPGSSAATYESDIICKKPEPKVAPKVDPLVEKGKACDGGDVKACLEVGVARIEGNVGTRDPEEAGKRFKAACDGAEMTGCVRLGILHVTGLGVEKSEEKAEALFTKACDAEDMYGCARLGKLHYINRKGKPAKKFCTLACEGGSMEGCLYLGQLYLEGIGVKANFEKARTYFEPACDSEVMEACTNLGVMLMRGEGGAKNIARAKELFTTACEAKVQPACYHLRKLK